MTEPRILVVGPRLGVGGTERHLAQLVPALARRGLDMNLHVMERGGVLDSDIVAAGVPIDGAEAGVSRYARVRATVAGLVRRIRTLHPDIVHLFLPEPTLLGSLACEIAGHRCRIVSRRSLSHYRRSYPGLGLIERPLQRRTTVFLGKPAAGAAPPGADCKKPAKGGFIHKCVVTATPAGATTRLIRRAAIGLDRDDFAIVVIANLIAYKGHADLLAALADASSRLPPHWRVVFVGRDDGQGAALDAQAAALGIFNRLIRLGERPDAADLAGACDIAVLPSHQEGFSNALVEGLARGLPTIATAIGGNLDAIEDGRTGLLVPVSAPYELSARLCRLAEDRDLATQLGASARADVAERFGFVVMVDRYERLYRNQAQLGCVPVSSILEGMAAG